MFNILIPLGAFLSAGMGFLAVRAATGLGIGLITYDVIDTVLTALFFAAQTHYNSIPAFAFSIINLAGFGQAFGIIAAAITFRASFVFMSRLGVIPK